MIKFLFLELIIYKIRNFLVKKLLIANTSIILYVLLNK